MKRTQKSHYQLALFALALISSAALAQNITQDVGLNIVDNAGNWLVINDVVQENFERRAYPADVYGESEVIVTLSWSWNQFLPNATASLNATYKVFFLPEQSSAGVLESAQLSLPAVGEVPHTLTPFNVTFNCIAVGSVSLGLVFVITPVGGSADIVPVLLTKSCIPPQCAGLCVHGVCAGTHCICDPGWDFSPFCDFGFTLSATSVCPGDPVTLAFDWSDTNSSTSLDWINILRPDTDHLTQPWTEADLELESPDLWAYDWWYVSGTPISTLATTVNHNSYVLRIWDSYPGYFGIAFFKNYGYEAAGFLNLYVKSDDDPNCAPSAPLNCVHGHPDAGNTWCVCEQGFFGKRCEHGCARWAELSGFGEDFYSDVGGDAYQNWANCSWLIEPRLLDENDQPLPVTGITLWFERFGVEPHGADYATISAWRDGQAGPVLNPLSGYQGAGFLQSYSEQALLVQFVTDNVRPSETYAPYFGFDATYFALGCPAGHVTTRFVDEGVWRCVACPLGAFSTVADTQQPCAPCPVGTFSSSNGSTACEQCAIGTFQDERGQTSCKQCADFDFPSPCPPNPSLATAQVGGSSFLIAMAVLPLIASAAGVVVFKNNRVIFTASPFFLLLLLAGAALFVVAAILHVLPQTDTLCNVKLWLGHISFQIVFGALFAKTYRLHRIFNNPILRALKIPSGQLLLGILALIACDVIVLAVWTARAPFTLVNPSERECISSESSTFVPILLAIKAALLLYGVYLTYRVWNIPSAYNESKYIGIALYNILTLALIVFLLVYLGSLSVATQTLIEALGMAYGVFATVSLIMMPKFKAIYNARATGIKWHFGTKPHTSDETRNNSRARGMTPHASDIAGAHSPAAAAPQKEKFKQQLEEVPAEPSPGGLASPSDAGASVAAGPGESPGGFLSGAGSKIAFNSLRASKADGGGHSPGNSQESKAANKFLVARLSQKPSEAGSAEKLHAQIQARLKKLEALKKALDEASQRVLQCEEDITHMQVELDFLKRSEQTPVKRTPS